MRSQIASRGAIIIIYATILMFSGACSSSSPDSVVRNFFDALVNSELAEAKSYLMSEDKPSLEFSNERNKNVVVKVFNLIKYSTIATNVNGDTAIAKVEITTPDMEKITLRVINDVMAKVAKMSEDGQIIETYDSEKLAEEYFIKMLSDPEVQMITSEFEIKLTKENGIWLINGDSNFKNIITGNMIKSTTGN